MFHVHVYIEIFLVDKFLYISCTHEIKTTCYTQLCVTKLLQIIKNKTTNFCAASFHKVCSYQPAVYTTQNFQQCREGSANSIN